jgi:hypothetical protein
MAMCPDPWPVPTRPISSKIGKIGPTDSQSIPRAHTTEVVATVFRKTIFWTVINKLTLRGLSSMPHDTMLCHRPVRIHSRQDSLLECNRSYVAPDPSSAYSKNDQQGGRMVPSVAIA